MQPVSWVSLAGSTVNALIPAHGDAVVPDGTNAFVFWALPVAKFFFNVSGAAVTGALVLACTALKPGSREHARTLAFAGVSAVVWMLAAIGAGFLDYLDKWDQPVAFTESFGRQLGYFFTHVGLGQMWLTTMVITAVLPLLCFGARHLSGTTVAAVVALAGWIPLALIGHPNYGEGHEAGILAFALHLVAAAAWLGGLMTLIVLRPVLDGQRLNAVVKRYSTLALVAFCVLVFSGFLRAQVTVGTVENLRSAFGTLVAVKIAAVLLLGLVGFVQRRWILSRMGRDSSGRSPSFWPLVGLEVLIMGLASGAAVTLLRLDEPIPDDPVVNYRVLAEKMADEPLPPAPGVAVFLTETMFDPLWAVLIVAGATSYAAGVRRVRRQGGHWPGGRTVSWAIGMLALLYVTNGGVNQYQNFLLSVQVLAQMALTAVVAVLLVLGRPLTLARLTVRPRDDGSRGGREWLQALGRSGPVQRLLRPSVATGLLMLSVLVFYLSPLLEWSARELLGHQWMVIHFLAIGCSFVTSVLRTAHGAAQPPRGSWRALLAVAGFYVVLGGALVLGTHLLSAEWYAAMEQPWGIDPVADQHRGGWYVLALGAVQVAVLGAVLVGRRRRAVATMPASSANPAPGTSTVNARAASMF